LKSKSIKLSIPTPCYENWDNMTPNERGRHCDSCNKTVVDFSLFSDRQIIEFFTKATGHVCGRFTNLQLERQLVYVEPRNSFLYKLLFGTAISLGIAGSANANYNPNNNPLLTQHFPKLAGSIEEPHDPSVDTLHSIWVTVIDSETHSALPFASVEILADGKQAGGGQTDLDGNTRIDRLGQYDLKKLTIKIVYPGYEDKTITGLSPKVTVALKPNVSEMNKMVTIQYEKGFVGPHWEHTKNPTIAVKIYDYKTKKPINNASVILLWNDTLEASGKSDSTGSAALEYHPIYPGLKYVVKIENDGYKTFETEITSKKAGEDSDVVNVYLKHSK